MDETCLSKNPNFLKLWIGLSISNFGDVLLTIWSITVVSQESNSAFYVALIFMSGVLPDLLFTLVSGSIADSVNSRKLLSATSFLQMAILLPLIPGVLLLNEGLVWLIIVVNVFQSIANTLFNSANQIILPQIVDSSLLPMAHGRIKLSSELCSLAGYGFGGVLLVFVSPAAIIVTDAASFLIVAVLAILIKFRPLVKPEAKKTPSLSFMLNGVRFISNNRSLRVLLVWAFLSSLSVAPFMVALPEVVKGLGNANPMLLSWHFMALSIGSLIASTMIGWRSPKNHLHVLVASGLGLFSAIILMSLTQVVMLSLTACVVVGFVSLYVSVVLISAVQQQTPQDLMGRVCSGFNFIVQIGLPPTFLLIGLMSSHINIKTILLVSSIGIAGATAILLANRIWDIMDFGRFHIFGVDVKAKEADE